MKWSHFLEKKKVLFSPKSSPEELIRWGDHYMSENRLHDAAAFYGQAHHEKGLQQIRQVAVEEGDVQLYLEALNGLDPAEAGLDDLRRLARAAEQRGRWNDAKRAYTLSNDTVGAKRAQAALEALMGKSGGDDSSRQGG